MRRLVLLGLVALVLSGCGGANAPASQPSTSGAGAGSASPHTSSTASAAVPPPTAAGAGVWQLRYRLLGHYPTFAYCDPDLYPVARDDEQVAADQWWARVDRGSAEVSTILTHHGYREPLTGSQRLTAYRDHKKLAVIDLTVAGSGYRYQLSVGPSGAAEPDQTVTGVITFDGVVHETARQARRGGCPICLEAGTRIATPRGDRPVNLIRPGDQVWTTDLYGHRIATIVDRVIRRDTSGPHLMLQLTLSDGRTLVAAGAHPGADGRYLRELRPGQRYDGATVSSTVWITSTAPATFDLLPDGPSATYWADGILIGSTLKPQGGAG
jgi:hypothetical protein